MECLPRTFPLLAPANEVSRRKRRKFALRAYGGHKVFFCRLVVPANSKAPEQALSRFNCFQLRSFDLLLALACLCLDG